MLITLIFLLVTQLVGARSDDWSTHSLNAVAALLITWGGLVLIHENVLRFRFGLPHSSNAIQMKLQSQDSLPAAAAAHAGPIASTSSTALPSSTPGFGFGISVFMELLALTAATAGCLILARPTSGWVGIGWWIGLMVVDSLRWV